MRLTLIISSLECGGAERVLSLLANAWTSRGEDVTILTFGHETKSFFPLSPAVQHLALGLTVESKGIVSGLRANVRRIRLLRRYLQKSAPDVIIAFTDRVNILTILASCGMSTPVIISERSDPSQWPLEVVWNSLRAVTYPFADALVCQTSGVAARLRILVNNRATVIPNAILPLGVCVQRPFQRENCIVAMGRLVPEKGFDLLLRAFHIISSNHPNWCLKILGDGQAHSELSALASALGIANRVCFLGRVSDPVQVLCRAGLFVLSSRVEGFPNALCEAMSCGMPVISFDCPSGPADIVRHGIDGLLVKPGDVDELATAMDHLLSDANARNRLAARAPEVVQRFSQESVLRCWQVLLEEVRCAR